MDGLKAKVNRDFWAGKRVFITGHTGFKGSWLSLWLQDMGAIVKGYSLAPYTAPNLFEVAHVAVNMESELGDIRDLDKITQSMTSFDPEILIHMAAQPLVRLSYSDPVNTYSTNVMGTLNVLEASRKCRSLRSVVSITTDKCYDNKEWPWGYREIDPMGGHDPYSSSKGCCELLIASYRNSFFNTSDSAYIASARAGNVIGGGDWSHDRLIPDILQSFEKNEPVIVRNPKSTRPWQHVLEPLSGYLILAEKLYTDGDRFAGAWNFGPADEDCKSVEWILNTMTPIWGERASWKLDESSHPHEAGFLKLDCSKASQFLNWKPQWTLKHTLELIVKWQKSYLNTQNMKTYCLSEIKQFENN